MYNHCELVNFFATKKAAVADIVNATPSTTAPMISRVLIVLQSPPWKTNTDNVSDAPTAAKAISGKTPYIIFATLLSHLA